MVINYFWIGYHFEKFRNQEAIRKKKSISHPVLEVKVSESEKLNWRSKTLQLFLKKVFCFVAGEVKYSVHVINWHILSYWMWVIYNSFNVFLTPQVGHYTSKPLESALPLYFS